MTGPCSNSGGSVNKITTTTSPVSQTGSGGGSAAQANGHHHHGHHHQHHHQHNGQHHHGHTTVAGGSTTAPCKAYCTGTEDEVLIVRRSDVVSTTDLITNGNGGNGYSNGVHSIGGGMYSGGYVGTGSSQVTTIL